MIYWKVKLFNLFFRRDLIVNLIIKEKFKLNYIIFIRFF